MTIAIGVNKQVKYKVESAWGTVPAASGAQLLRRVSSNIGLKKDTYSSNEIRTDYQDVDFRHGVKRVSGTLSGELSPLTYSDFIAAACRKVWAATAAITGASITVAGSGPTYTVTRGAGSYLTDGVKIGDVVELTAGAFNAANLNKNLGVVSLTATIATVIPLNGVAMVAEGPIASATVTITGKRVWVPSTGHTDPSYAIEHWYSDISQSEVFSGCKVSTITLNLPATGLATIDIGFMGKDLDGTASGTAEYFTSPTALTSTGLLAAVNGVVRYGAASVATITGMSLNYNGGMKDKPVVGSNNIPDIHEGRSLWDGQFTVLFENATYRDAFRDETTASISAWLTAGSGASDDFIGITLPKIKLNSHDVPDGEDGLEATVSFKALRNTSGGSGISSEDTTVVFQDSNVS